MGSLLKENDCDFVQGFYYYKPMPTAELVKLFKKAEDKEIIYLKEFNPSYIK